MRTVRTPGGAAILAYRAHTASKRALLARISLLLVLDLVLVVLAASVLRLGAQVADERLVLGQWEPLDGKTWVTATTGWRAPGQSDLPLVDVAYDGNPISLGGRAFEDGLALYPFAEVVYRLDDAYSQLQVTVGVEPRVWIDGGAARFLVYGDSAL